MTNLSKYSQKQKKEEKGRDLTQTETWTYKDKIKFNKMKQTMNVVWSIVIEAWHKIILKVNTSWFHSGLASQMK